jgi:tetratricopeptide (TPR) repeat protein
MQQALAILREQNEPSWEAWSLVRIGYAHSDLSQQEKAVEYLGRGLGLYQAAKNRSGEAEALVRLGTVYVRLTQYEKAFDQLQRALVINREIKSRAGKHERWLVWDRFVSIGVSTTRQLNIFRQLLQSIRKSRIGVHKRSYSLVWASVSGTEQI